MITDLVRNDFAKLASIADNNSVVVRPGSVHCPELLKVESYKRVRQLVTTVRAEVPSNCNNNTSLIIPALSAVSALFPPGSMTGAPKLRSC